MALTSLSACEREGKVRNECMAGLTLPLCRQINQSLVFGKKKQKTADQLPWKIRSAHNCSLLSRWICSRIKYEQASHHLNHSDPQPDSPLSLFIALSLSLFSHAWFWGWRSVSQWDGQRSAALMNSNGKILYIHSCFRGDKSRWRWGGHVRLWVKYLDNYLMFCHEIQSRYWYSVSA